MLKQTTSEKTAPTDFRPSKTYRVPPWALLAIILAAIAGFFIIPIVIPALIQTLSGPTPQAYWYISRASAFVAYILIWISMLAGLSITSKAGRRWPGLPSSFELHRYTSLLGLGFAALHALVLLGDQYMSYSLGQLLVPFLAGSYKTQWIGLGQVAIYALGVVAFSFYIRNRLGVRAWRLIHSLSFALFLMTLVHGLQSGTDSGNWWASTLYWGSAATVLLGSIYRVLAARIGRSKHAVATTGLIAVAGKAQTPPKMRVLSKI